MEGRQARPSREDMEEQQGTKQQQKSRPNNVRTGLILASIALAFFVGIFVKRMWFN